MRLLRPAKRGTRSDGGILTPYSATEIASRTNTINAMPDASKTTSGISVCSSDAAVDSLLMGEVMFMVN